VEQVNRELAETALDGAYAQVTEVITGLDDASFFRPSRCAGWVVGDVLYHQLLDARRALRTFATPGSGPPDRDDVSYWRPFGAGGEIPPGSEAAAEHARHVRIAASAFDPDKLTWEWTDTAGAACRAARACRYELVATQGHVLRTADFVATLAVESAVHYLDMVAGLTDPPPSDPIPLRLVRRVLDGLLGQALPLDWDDETYVLKGTGRLDLTETERASLGPAAERFPLFG
jgi:Mycothiol maleylpyruvate isomerase N-terminal domain